MHHSSHQSTLLMIYTVVMVVATIFHKIKRMYSQKKNHKTKMVSKLDREQAEELIKHLTDKHSTSASDILNKLGTGNKKVSLMSIPVSELSDEEKKWIADLCNKAELQPNQAATDLIHEKPTDTDLVDATPQINERHAKSHTQKHNSIIEV